MGFERWKKFSYDFLTIFIGVFAAFALENWKDNQNNVKVRKRILTEIRNGLEKDLHDIQKNDTGHSWGIRSVRYFQRVLQNEPAPADSFIYHQSNLFRSFISLQNTSGYEALKSKGLELIEDDSLRTAILTMYEYDYNILKKLEEDYAPLQFEREYANEFFTMLSPALRFNEKSQPAAIRLPLRLKTAERNRLLMILWHTGLNRRFIRSYIAATQDKITQLIKQINEELEDEGPHKKTSTAIR